MLFKKPSNVTWLVVGLGNPGDRYENTRHNVGFEVMDELGERGNFPIRKLKHKALTQTAEIGGQRVLVMKPNTFMNLSGEAVIDAANFYKVPADHVLVVCDDVSLPLGKIRIRRSGSAGGHNGLSNAEDPAKPQAPYERLVELRRLLRTLGLDNIPIILAGGIWSLKDWQDYIDNPDIGKIAFQFGTRPMITKESPISEAWKKVMLQVKKGDVILQKFSPTGFFSSAIKNTFLEKLILRKQGEIAFSKEQTSEFSHPLSIRENKTVYIKPEDAAKAEQQLSVGHTEIQETPDSTVVFLTPAEWKQMKQDRAECVGCLSQCQFSTWSRANGTTGKLPDPRSYCIHKTLYEVGHNGSIKDNLLFAGHQVYRFATDPLYRNGIPTVKELIEKIKNGE